MLRNVLAVLICLLCARDAHLKALDEDQHHNIVKRSTKCYPRVGCFTTGAPFHSLQRPINLLPLDPDLIKTKFLLYTQEDKTHEAELDARHPDTFQSVWPNYKATRPTKIICHGFLDSTHINPWMKEMKDEFLVHGDYNTIITDWHLGNLPPYTQATGNTRLVGAQMADLIKTIIGVTGQDPGDFHIIGHSLGAHIGGYAGERVPGLGRITGMDPAGPYFEDTDPRVRLDPTDAVFVDNIHTDGDSILQLGFGSIQQSGHADYYPNLGHDQPGCQDSPVSQVAVNGVVQGAQEYVACNHLRSWKFMIESINTQCPFTGIPCNNEEDFKNGKCSTCGSQGCGMMGMRAVKPAQPTRYFLSTADHAPYCQYHFTMMVKLTAGHTRERGTMKVLLQGDKGSTGWITLNEDIIDFQPGSTYTHTFGVPSDIGHVTSVDFSWEHRAPLTDPFKWNLLGMRHPTLMVDEIDLDQLEFSDTKHFCVPGHTVETSKVLTLNTLCSP